MRFPPTDYPPIFSCSLDIGNASAQPSRSQGSNLGTMELTKHTLIIRSNANYNISPLSLKSLKPLRKR